MRKYGVKKVHVVLPGEQKTLCGRNINTKPGHIGHIKSMLPHTAVKKFTDNFICLRCKVQYLKKLDV